MSVATERLLWAGCITLGLSDMMAGGNLTSFTQQWVDQTSWRRLSPCVVEQAASLGNELHQPKTANP
jgi:hypothetical protein